MPWSTVRRSGSCYALVTEFPDDTDRLPGFQPVACPKMRPPALESAGGRDVVRLLVCLSLGLPTAPSLRALE